MFQQATTPNKILCPSCGVLIEPNAANLCISCIRNQVDITDGIPKQATLHFCRGCDRNGMPRECRDKPIYFPLQRYLQPPNVWVACELESRELLAVCLKKLKLSKVRLVDAGFIWTEPHSKRIKVKLSIQKEVFAATILQQVFVVEFTVAGQYCDECARVDAQLTWKAVVQVRQKVPHKRTFLWLEQLILKHNAHKDTSNIKEFRDGLDFYYTNRNLALKMVQFLESVVPCRMKSSEQLISSDSHSGVGDYKFTYSVEIVPICKDDLLCLTVKGARTLSNISPVALCLRVSNALVIIDPQTAVASELRAQPFWEAPFSALAEVKEMIEFYVIDIQIESRVGKYAIAMAEVARSGDLSKTFFVRTHLGNILNAGDHAMGYMLAHTNFNHDNYEALLLTPKGRSHLQDVILVKKSYPNARKRTKNRTWKLKSIKKEEGEEEAEQSKRQRNETQKAEQDYELFLRDMEEDPELRGMINLYKSDAKVREDVSMIDSDEEPELDFPEIQLDELMDEMGQMQLDDHEPEQ